jgi:hypothetical protein
VVEEVVVEAHFSSAAPGAQVIAQETAPRSGTGSLGMMIMLPTPLTLLIRLTMTNQPSMKMIGKLLHQLVQVPPHGMDGLLEVSLPYLHSSASLVKEDSSVKEGTSKSEK